MKCEYLYAYTYTHAFLQTVKSKTRHILMLQMCADINTELKQFLVFVGTKYFEKLKQDTLKQQQQQQKSLTKTNTHEGTIFDPSSSAGVQNL